MMSQNFSSAAIVIGTLRVKDLVQSFYDLVCILGREAPVYYTSIIYKKYHLRLSSIIYNKIIICVCLQSVV